MSESEPASASVTDLLEDFERSLEEIELAEVVSTIDEMLVELMGDAYTLPNPSSSYPPLHPAEPDLSPLPQTEGIHIGAYHGCTPMGAALDVPSVGPSSLQQTHLNSAAGAHRQDELQSEDHRVFLTNERKSEPVVPHPHIITALYPVQVLNGALLIPFSAVNGEMLHVLLPLANLYLDTGSGQMLQVFPAAAPLNTCSSVSGQKLDQVLPAAAPLNTCSSVKKKGKKSIKKKPLNAYKLFSNEQKSKGLSELQDKSISAVNKIIRQKWNSLPKEQKGKYFQQASSSVCPLCSQTHM